MATRYEKGRRGEDLAAEYLEKHGMMIVTRNFRCPLGEIDIVGRDGKTVVFVEVRSRSSSSRGFPQESIRQGKQKKLTQLARWYLRKHGLDRQPARFDVIAINWRGNNPEVTWIVNAFEACE